MLASLVVGVCTVWSCSSINDPSRRPPVSAVPEANTPVTPYPVGGTGTFDQGCATFEVTVSGSSTITVTTVAGSTCGSIQPVIFGTSTWSSATRKVRLSVALKNVGTSTYLPAATVISWPDSLRQVLPAAPPPIVMSFLNPDYTNPDTASVMPSARFWKYDTLLVSSSALLQRLDPTKTSRARLIDISLGAGLTKIRVALQGKAQLVDFAVPALPPDSITVAVMKQIYSAANVVATDSVWGGPYPRNVVTILFHTTASQADRQAAIGSINGEVIGGLPINSGGVYYVRVPDNGSTAPLHAAVRNLRANPKVKLAMPDLMGAGRSWAAPVDGTNWKKTDWRLKPLSANGQNLPQEAVALPLAWGCQAGDSTLRVAIVDAGFYDVADLRNNLAPHSLSMFAKDTLPHGTWVASLLAAQGNNGTGMSGAMWRAQLDYYDVNPDATIPSNIKSDMWWRVAWRLIEAGSSGAPIINLSMGINWIQAKGHRPSLTGIPADVQKDTLYLSGVRNTMETALGEIHARGFHPLIIVAAGNDSVDAWWSGTSALRDMDSTRVIVVGGSKTALPGDGPFRKTLTGLPALSSNFGSRVDIAASGVAHVIGKNGSIASTAFTGTSLAAPVISGIAGLLLSANPGTPADSLKHLIMTGAQRDTRGPVAQMGGAKLANAYESLKAAAERPGTALCGNQVYPIDDQIAVQRAGSVEVIGTANAPIYSVSAGHGGHYISFSTTSGGGSLNLSGGSWTMGPAPTPVPVPAGLEGSVWGVSHEGDSLAYLDRGTVGQVKVYIRKPNGSNTLVATIAETITTDMQCSMRQYARDAEGNIIPDTYVCIYESDVNIMTPPWADDWYHEEAKVAFSPFGDRVLVSLPHAQNTYTAGTWFGYPVEPSCPSNTQCRRFPITRNVTNTQIYSVPLPSGAASLQWNVPGTLRGLGINEDGTQAMYQDWTYQSYYEYTVMGPDFYIPHSFTMGACSLVYRPIFGGGAGTTQGMGVSCLERVGTIAPVIAVP